jgi:hypothetical protein
VTTTTTKKFNMTGMGSPYIIYDKRQSTTPRRGGGDTAAEIRCQEKDWHARTKAASVVVVAAGEGVRTERKVALELAIDPREEL